MDAEWRHVFGAMQLVEHLLEHGSAEMVREAHRGPCTDTNLANMYLNVPIFFNFRHLSLPLKHVVPIQQKVGQIWNNYVNPSIPKDHINGFSLPTFLN